MYLNKKTALASAVLIALSNAPALAQSSNEIQSLKNTVEELRKQLEELKAQIGKPGEGPTPIEGESQESLDARTPSSKADIQGLRTDLENYKYDESRKQERTIPTVTRNTKIGGSITARYDFNNPGIKGTSNTNAQGSSVGPTDYRQSGFNAVAFGLNFAGNLYRDYAEGRNITYRLALTSQHAPNSSQTGVNLTDAYLRYSFKPSTGNPEDPLGTITLGQQTVAFGQDAQAIDPEVKAVIGNAGFVAGLGLGTRQTGLVIAGDYEPYVDFTNNYRAPLIAYSFGVLNGNGNNKADNNDYRDFVARLVYTLPVDYSSWFRQFQVGGSYYRGYTSLGPDSSTAQTVQAEKGRFDRYGFDINWTHLPFSVSYEWAYGKQELYKLNTLVTTGVNADGFQRGVGQYINFGYTWGEQFLASSRQQGKFDDYWPQSYQAFVRFDTWDPNRAAGKVDDKKIATTLGLNVFFAETTKFQVNYVRTRNQLNGAPSTDVKPETENIWQLQLNATF